jgi:hypothetical protein
MSGATEIYLCKAGQELKQGRMEFSDSITTRAEAEVDAVQRCKWDKKLAKIAYYAVNDEGDFKIILTYNNPNTGDEEEEKPKKIKKKPEKKPGLMTRVIQAVTGSGSSKTKKKKKTASKKKKRKS